MELNGWKRRYKQAFIDQAHVTDKEAQQCLDAAEFPSVMDYYETDPEGAAAMEISYWET